jgi:hypothetical protein
MRTTALVSIITFDALAFPDGDVIIGLFNPFPHIVHNLCHLHRSRPLWSLPSHLQSQSDLRPLPLVCFEIHFLGDSALFRLLLS